MASISSLALFLLPLFAVPAFAQCWRNVTCDGPTDATFPGTWESNIYSPSTRVVSPKTILSWPNLNETAYPETITLPGNLSLITYDFGIEVGGIVTVSYTASGTGEIGLAFSEAKNWIGYLSDSSNGAFAQGDGYLTSAFTSGNGSYTMPDKVLRGGFRYLTVFLLADTANASLSLTDISLELSFQPTWSNLRAYKGYFHSSDLLLNRIWYAGAYTLQTNAVPVNTGRQIPTLKHGWANNATLGLDDTIIVDGAKRDRAVWPGDMGIAVPSMFVSIGDLESVKNALQVMYDYQNLTTGAFDESGPPLSQKNSDTYHMWTMVGTYNYMLYSNNTAFLEENWAGYQLAMNYVLGKVDSSGLMNVTGTRDWARWQQGFHNSEANMILYHTLITGAVMAGWMDDQSLGANWTLQAVSLKTAINARCWDGSYGAFKDNDTNTTLHPQDANSLAVLFNVTSSSRAESISEKLTKNWTPIGPVAPELPENISPFISSFELQSHFTLRNTTRALSLLRTTWGWIINNANSTESTIIEGYLQNGTFGYRSSRGYYYDASYISHSHGWSSGPTSALTNFILGLEVTSPAGVTWSLQPQFGDLESVEGGFVTSLGKFSANWNVSSTGSWSLSWCTPEESSGIIRVPDAGINNFIELDGDHLNATAGEIVNVKGGCKKMSTE
ncbi:MAG: hypothetical protein M1834_008748 [Cirrosporium novae-zelandiae]|nr:MAG: hypothetical protein M1834_008748 [Cirrosporium novae-zelandiae]